MIYVLLEQVRSECEAECLLEDCILASSSREVLEEKKEELELEQARLINVITEFKNRARNIDLNSETEFRNDPDGFRNALKHKLAAEEKIRVEMAKIYDVNKEYLQVWYSPDFTYEIIEVESI